MRGRRAVLCFLFNGRWDGLYGHARRLGIPIATVDTRVHRYGNTPEARAKILAPYHLHRAQKFLWNGAWGTAYEHAARLGIGKAALETRIHRYGNRPETWHVILHPGRLSKLYSYRGEWKTAWEWSRILGRSEGGIARVCADGVITDERLSRLHRPHRICAADRYTIGGESLTVVEWARRTGVRTDTLKRRMGLGMSLEEAISYRRAASGRKKQHGYGKISDSAKQSLRALGIVI